MKIFSRKLWIFFLFFQRKLSVLSKTLKNGIALFVSVFYLLSETDGIKIVNVLLQRICAKLYHLLKQYILS